VSEVIACLLCIVVQVSLCTPHNVFLLVYVLPARVDILRLVQQERAVGDERDQEHCDVACGTCHRIGGTDGRQDGDAYCQMPRWKRAAKLQASRSVIRKRYIVAC